MATDLTLLFIRQRNAISIDKMNIRGSGGTICAHAKGAKNSLWPYR